MSDKNLNIVKIVLLVIVAILLTMLLVVLLNFDKFKNFGLNKYFTINSKSEEVYNEDFLESEINKIKIKTDSIDVKIKKSDDDKIKVIIKAPEENNALVKNNNGVLEIGVKDLACIGFCFERSLIEVYLPSQTDKNLVVNASSSNLTMDSFPNINLYTVLTSGDIVLNELNDVEVITTSGNIELERAKNVNVKVTSGDIRINNIKNGIVKSSSGNINVKNSEEDLTLMSTSGDINIGNINVLSNSKITSSSGNVIVNQTNKCYINTETNSGTVKIKKSDRYSKNELYIKTTSGDIRVN